jgi:hypothetical protein
MCDAALYGLREHGKSSYQGATEGHKENDVQDTHYITDNLEAMESMRGLRQEQSNPSC